MARDLKRIHDVLEHVQARDYVVAATERQVQGRVEVAAEVVHRQPRLGARRLGIDHERRCVRREQQDRRGKLRERSQMNHEKCQEVADGDLLQHANELNDDTVLGVGIKHDADGDEQETAFDDVEELPAPRLP